MFFRDRKSSLEKAHKKINTEFEKDLHKLGETQTRDDVSSILNQITMDKSLITPEDVNIGVVLGYRGVKNEYKNAIDNVMEENRKLKAENLILKANNESLANELELLKNGQDKLTNDRAGR